MENKIKREMKIRNLTYINKKNTAHFHKKEGVKHLLYTRTLLIKYEVYGTKILIHFSNTKTKSTDYKVKKH